MSARSSLNLLRFTFSQKDFVNAHILSVPQLYLLAEPPKLFKSRRQVGKETLNRAKNFFLWLNSFTDFYDTHLVFRFPFESLKIFTLIIISIRFLTICFIVVIHGDSIDYEIAQDPIWYLNLLFAPIHLKVQTHFLDNFGFSSLSCTLENLLDSSFSIL